MAIMTSWLRRRGGRPRDRTQAQTQAQTQTLGRTDEAGTGSTLPHERDQSTDASHVTPDPREVKAHEDLKAGRKDTGRESAIEQFQAQQNRQRRRRPLGG